MLVIRPDQMEVLQSAVEEEFVHRIARHLRSERVELGSIPPSDLYEMIRTGIARARGYGMQSENTLAAFVGLMFGVAPNFDDVPAIRRVPTDPEVLPDARVDELWRATTDADWEQARTGRDPETWMNRSRR